MATVVSCPTCAKEVQWSEQSPYRPFCSKRCQLIDLGEWSSEGNVISSPVGAGDGASDGQPTPEMIEEVEAMLAQIEAASKE